MKSNKHFHRLWRRRMQPLWVLLALALGLSSIVLSLIGFWWNAAPASTERAAVLQQSVVAIGVRYRDQGNEKYLRLGTGFLARVPGTDDVVGVTAGHVILESMDEYNNLLGKDLSPAYVAFLHDGTVSEIGSLRYHPNLLTGFRRDRPEPYDVGVFRFLGVSPPTALDLSEKEARVGDPLTMAGYPKVETLQLLQERKPVVKSGFIEQLFTGGGDRPIGQIIQHGIPAPGGCSGSPLVNDHCEVVGVISLSTHRYLRGNDNEVKRVLDAADVNFAVPVSALRPWAVPPRD